MEYYVSESMIKNYSHSYFVRVLEDYSLEFMYVVNKKEREYPQVL